jgi:cell division protein ZipA
MNDLQLTLIVVGIGAIGAVLLHGLWVLRRQNRGQKNQVRDYRIHPKKKTMAPTVAPETSQNLGAESPEIQEPEWIEPTFKTSERLETQPQNHEADEKTSTKTGLDATEQVDVPASLKPREERLEENSDEHPEEHPEVAMASVDLYESEPYFDLMDKEASPTPPKISKEQQAPKFAPKLRQNAIQVNTISDVLVIHIKASSHHPYPGNKVLACMETLNLKFGMMNIFHHCKEEGEPIFSAANMAVPGTFDIKAMPTSEYYGISLFLRLPLSDPLMGFSLLLNAASTFVNQLGGQLLNDQREPWRQDSKIKYLERIKLVSQEVPVD